MTAALCRLLRNDARCRHFEADAVKLAAGGRA
jgi:hypothetical protein